MLWLIAAMLGPIGKFESETPSLETLSQVPISEIERCLLDMDGWPVPHVYRQPDRPDEVRLIWTDPNGRARNRADLRRTNGGTQVRLWIDARQARACVRPAP